MIAFRAFLFQLAFYPATTLIAMATVPLLVLPRPAVRAAERVWVRTTFFLAHAICRISYEVRGRENLPPPPFLLASKHQSAWDTMVYLVEAPDTVYVLKRELLMIPFFGWAAWRAGHVGIDRKAGAAAMRAMLRGAEKHVARGGVIAIFPEGTRTAPGTTGTYQPGAAALYRHLGLPVVPAAVNSGLFWPRRRFLKYPGKITLAFGPPIPAGLDRKTFMARLEREIEGMTRSLEAEVPPRA